MIPAPPRLWALLKTAVEHRWTVSVRPNGSLLQLWLERGDTAIEVMWESRGSGYRLGSCELLGQPRPDGSRYPSTRLLLRDVPALLREVPVLLRVTS